MTLVTFADRYLRKKRKLDFDAAMGSPAGGAFDDKEGAF